MLSKVVSRADAGGIQKLVFPQLGESPSVSRVSFQPSLEGSPGDQSSDLREKVQELESRLVTERLEAFEAGKIEGEKQARVELQPVLVRLNASTSEILDMRSDLRRRAERDVVQLALLIAKRVLHRQLTVDEGALTAIARIAFERLSRSESYRITVNPQFEKAIASALPAGHASRVQLDSDPDCALGTLIIRSTEGTIDASIDAQLEEISRGLTDKLSHF
jgi:flagellar assembly protein FliH